MRVLHLSVSDSLDSASRAALNLHRKLLSRGVNSRMLVRNSASAPEIGVEKIDAVGQDDADPFSIVQSLCFDSNESSPTSSAFETGYPGIPIAGHPAVGDCDIVHLHQVAGFLTPLSIRELLAVGKPVVWSIPDAWPFTGGCFQPGICRAFRAECAACPQLSTDEYHLPQALLKDKLGHLAGVKNLSLVAPNEWLANLVCESKVFHGLRAETIAPVFFDAPASRAIRSESEPLRFVLLFEPQQAGARAVSTLKALLEAAQTYGSFRRLVRQGQVLLTVIGAESGSLENIGLPLRCAGFGESASTILASSDLLILPRQDMNRSATILEARAYGLPILAYDSAEISPFIAHRKNGWLVQRMEPRPLAEAMAWLAANPAMVRAMAQIAPEASETDGVAKVLDLYERAIAGRTDPSQSEPQPAHAALVSLCGKITLETARRYLREECPAALRSRLEATERTLTGTENLLSEAQRNLAAIERRQQQVLDSKALPEGAKSKLKQTQKSTVSLRNKLKWRSRRLKVFSQPHTASSVQTSQAVTQPAPEIPPWARAFHAALPKNYWMKHGRKNQYPPRPVRPEKFPAPRLSDEDLPRIAVVTPSFSQGDFIEETIRSVIDQGYPNLAYAVQDAGSTDNTLAVIRRHADRITVWNSQPDSGQARAIVSGFEKIRGDVMAWLNSDDLFVRGALRFIGEYFKSHPDVDVIYGHRIIIDEHSREIARWVLPPHNPHITPYVDPVPQETLFWRAPIWEKVGGLDPSFRFALDWDLVARFQNAGAKIMRLPYFLGCFRVHSQQKLSVQAETVGAEESASVRRRETGHTVTHEELEPYKKWMEVHGAIYSRLLEMGMRL